MVGITLLLESVALHYIQETPVYAVRDVAGAQLSIARQPVSMVEVHVKIQCISL